MECSVYNCIVKIDPNIYNIFFCIWKVTWGKGISKWEILNYFDNGEFEEWNNISKNELFINVSI